MLSIFGIAYMPCSQKPTHAILKELYARRFIVHLLLIQDWAEEEAITWWEATISHFFNNKKTAWKWKKVGTRRDGGAFLLALDPPMLKLYWTGSVAQWCALSWQLISASSIHLVAYALQSNKILSIVSLYKFCPFLQWKFSGSVQFKPKRMRFEVFGIIIGLSNGSVIQLLCKNLWN